MRRRLLEAAIAVVLEESLRVFLPHLLPWAWLVILSLLTLEIINDERIKKHLYPIHSRLGRRGQMASYVIIFLIGGALLTFYWWGIGKVFHVSAQNEPQSQKGEQSAKQEQVPQPLNTPAHQLTAEEIADAVAKRLPRDNHGVSETVTAAVVRAPFNVNAGPALRTPNRDSFGELIAAFHRDTQYTVVPLNVSLYLRVTNLQPAPCRIDRYSVEIKTEDGTWVKLIRIEVRPLKIYVVNPPDLTKSGLVEIDLLDAALSRKDIKPHEQVEGWGFFEYPGDHANDKFTETYRVTIYDNTGATFTSPELVTGGDRANEGVQDAHLRLPSGEQRYFDLSRANFRHTSDPK